MRHADIRAYLEMVSDHVRVAAYRKAIDATCPGKVVIDLGAGPGILSHLALAAGAKKVFVIDPDPAVLAMAAGVAAKMGPGHRFQTILKRSKDVTMADLGGQRAEVVVCELLDSLGIGEGICEAMADVGRRLCTPGAVMVPRKLDVALALGTSWDLEELAGQWSAVGKTWGLPYDEIIETMPTVALSMSVTNRHRFTGWVPWQSVRLGRAEVVRHTLLPFVAFPGGRARAILAAWEAELAEGVVLSTYPESVSTHWHQGVMTLGGHLDLVQNERYILEMILANGSTKFSYAIQAAKDNTDPRVLRAFELGRALDLRV